MARRKQSEPVATDLCVYRDRGLYVPGLDCWLDSSKPRRRGFISHAHTDHYAAHETIFCTPETADMLALVKPFEEELPPIRPLYLGRTIEHGDLQVTLLPSGHILGAAMMHVTRGGESLLYSGDVRPSGSATTPPAQVVPADHLIVEDTFGALDEEFVGAEEGAARVVEFCRKCRARNRTPILVTTSNCGKAQEMVVALGQAGLAVALQSKIWHFTRLYERHGIPVSGYTRLRKD
ncbi:MAG TPA: MBL fold metallo-hydrolase, partial [Armatimonadota bacterium]|nr:MBL fold metallo-hydrolase [Armatimonadota bacterium]